VQQRASQEMKQCLHGQPMFILQPMMKSVVAIVG